jgi:hypothetical protein
MRYLLTSANAKSCHLLDISHLLASHIRLAFRLDLKKRRGTFHQQPCAQLITSNIYFTNST